MFSKKARILVIFIALLLLGYTLYERVYELSALVLAGVLFIAYGYFKDGTVVLAAKAYHNKDFDKAERLLKEIKNPDYLRRSRRGYYEVMLGNIELKKENLTEAERHFQIASRFPLRNENEKALVLTQLANLNLRKNEFEKAKAYLEVTNGLKVSLRVQDIIKKLEKEIKKGSG